MKIGTAYTGGVGNFYVWRSDDGTKDFIPIPSGVSTVQKTPDFVGWARNSISRTYALGGHTENLVITEQKRLLRMGISPPSNPWIISGATVWNQMKVVPSAGPGLTGSCSFAIRWKDTLHNRRSPLGAASPAQPFVNQGATISSVPAGPDLADLCVDKVEIWVSVDGGLFRLWATRDVAVSTLIITGSATGEAYSTTFLFPKVAFGCISTDRLFAAGNEQHPDRVYISSLGNPEEYQGLYIPTRNGEPVIGLKIVGTDTVYVQCRNSCYYIKGFGPSDYVMRMLKSRIGGFGQKSIVMLDDVALIPTQAGWFRYDGSSFTLLGTGEWLNTWRKTVADPVKRSCYEDGFGVIDYVSGVMKFLPRTPNNGESQIPGFIGYPTGGVNNYWIVDIDGLVPDGGGAGQSDLSFDQVNGDVHSAAAMLFDPDATVGQLFSGTYSGDIFLENQIGNVDKQAGSAIPITTIVHTPLHIIGTVAQNEDSFKTTDVWALFQCENLPVTLGVYAGNEFATQAAALNSASFAPVEVFTIPAGKENPADGSVLNPYVPRDKWLQPGLANSPGTCISIRLSVTQNADRAAEATIGAIWQRFEFVFTGWGYIASDGQEARPLGPYPA